MSVWEAVVLGLVQGIAEFLPISSSGHLVLFHAWFGLQEGALAFDILLHMGTLVAVLIYFRRDWVRLFQAALRSLRRPTWSDPDARLLVFLLVATIPGALAGALFGDWVEANLHESGHGPTVVASTLAGVGLLILLAEVVARHVRDVEKMTVWDALLIGTAQALALIPGVSRSGATMLMALFLGMKRAEAARFSFLMSAPIIAGAGLVKVPKLFDADTVGAVPMILGFLAAAVSGYFAIYFLLRFVRTASFRPFAYYRILLGILVGGLLFFQ